jgi:hypothetical protein
METKYIIMRLSINTEKLLNLKTDHNIEFIEYAGDYSHLEDIDTYIKHLHDDWCSENLDNDDTSCHQIEAEKYTHLNYLFPTTIREYYDKVNHIYYVVIL